MARPRSEFLKSLGKLFQIVKKVADQVLTLGGSDDDIARIDVDDELVDEIAKLLVAKGKLATMSSPTAPVSPLQADAERTGQIKNLPDGKTFGFIADDEPGRPDWFFHESGVSHPGFHELAAGDVVRFTLAEGPKKGELQAKDIRRVD
jgi:cold shock CspA family protein